MVGIWLVPLADSMPVVNRSYATVTRDFTTSGLVVVLQGPLSYQEVAIVIPLGANTSTLRCKVSNIRPVGAGLFVAGLEVLGLMDADQYPDLQRLAGSRIPTRRKFAPRGGAIPADWDRRE